jgi:hypothetical protein
MPAIRPLLPPHPTSVLWSRPTGAGAAQLRRSRWLAGLVLFACVGAATAQSGAAPLANVGPVFIDFGTINFGVRKTTPVTFRNLTTSVMTLAGGGVNAAGTQAGFSATTGSCGPTLAAGASCHFDYSFRPANNSGTELTGGTTIGVTSAGRTQNFSLSFVGRGSGDLVVMRPRTMDFGDWLIGETAVVPVIITNLQSSAVSFAGGGFNTANGFGASSGTCGGALAAGASCQFNYTFTPGQNGLLQNATAIGVTTAAPALAQNFPLSFSGTGVSSVGVVTIAPIAIDFGNVKIGSRVAAPITFSNIGAVPIDFGGGGVSSNTFAGAFLGGAGCGSGTAAAGASCTLEYSLRPNMLGPDSASTGMTFSRPGASQSETFQLSGVGIGELAQVSPVEFDFGEVAIGTTHTVPVTILNDGDLPLTGFVGGGVAFPFSQTNNCNGSLAPGATCTFNYQFSASISSIGPQQTLTLISFTNVSGLQPTKEIRMRATGVDRIFNNGFE